MKVKNPVTVYILLVGLAVSGCTGPSEEISASPPAPSPSSSSSATPTPAQTGDIMDSEISTIESDIA
ncbi:MAG TPA: hypothetical protein HA304_01815 [Methanosarcinales archaeon]|nr:hypothetical protein [Methanosarcinales archaeon]